MIATSSSARLRPGAWPPEYSAPSMSEPLCLAIGANLPSRRGERPCWRGGGLGVPVRAACRSGGARRPARPGSPPQPDRRQLIELLEPLTAPEQPEEPSEPPADQLACGWLTWPRNRGRLVVVSMIANRNGRSTTIVTGGGARNAAMAVMAT